MRAGQDVILPDFRCGAVVEDHVHARKRGGCVVHLLPIDSEVQTGAVFGLVMGLE